jgi:putative membrane-bound dehydrogenase-like protein
MPSLNPLSLRSLFIALSLFVLASNLGRAQESGWIAGAAKEDITPTEAMRLSGYAVRSVPTEEIDDRLALRAFYMKEAHSKPLVVVSIDAIGIGAWMTQAISEAIQKVTGMSRSQIVVCTTHSHTAPHVEGPASNLFTIPQTEEQKTATRRYSELIVQKAIVTIRKAIATARPATLSVGSDQAEFAINRRLVQNSKWVNFGVIPTAPVDRRVRVLKAIDSNGSPIAVLYQYACHCTSISPERNRISADWAGLSASTIETKLPGIVALPIIGTGADANPNPRGEYEHAKAHGDEMANSVLRAFAGNSTLLPSPTLTAFAYAGLEFERPDKAKLDAMAESKSPQERNLANNLRDILKRKDRIPESYPVPIHLWTFGKDLAWVFLGGEVVVDYQIRLERELSQFSQVWVAAYTDDVFGYVASERVKREGGYEVDSSMIYFNQPGPWVSGTEEKLVKAVLDLQRQERSLDEPLDRIAALKSIQVAQGWTIEQMAAEPLIQDPINLSFGADGKLWVLEMGDYPYGGDRTARVKCLEDTNDDGSYDQSRVFLDQLPFASGVYAWRDGILVACAPEVFFARDTDGDGKADEKRVILSGFALANPQHRVHGFTYGLDHRLYFGSGDGTQSVTLHALDGSTSQIDIRGGDLALDPDRHELSVESGPTQFIRSHDGWGNWFGNDNTHPIYHFVYDRNWIQPNAPRPRSLDLKLTTPASSPQVFPLSQPLDRFNDPLTASRYTSVCSTIINQSSGCGDEMRGDAIVCEPVHNLVSRFRLSPSGISWTASRHTQDNSSEWIRSSDPWFRPVRVVNAPDGTIWIADMYRRVIEHPTWIPDEWLARLDVTAGKDQGRLYRVYQSGFQPNNSFACDSASLEELVDNLSRSTSSVADLAQQQLISKHQADPSLVPRLAAGLEQTNPQGRLRCFAILSYLRKLEPSHWSIVLDDSDLRIVTYALRQLGTQPNPQALPAAIKAIAKNLDGFTPLSAMSAFYLVANQSSENASLAAKLLLKHSSVKGFDVMVDFVANERVGLLAKEILKLDQTGGDIYLNRLIPRLSSDDKKEIAKGIVTNQGDRPAWHFALARMLGRDESNLLTSDFLTKLQAESLQMLPQTDTSLPKRTAALDFYATRITSNSTKEIKDLIAIAINADVPFATRAFQTLHKLGDGAYAPLIQALTKLAPSQRSALVSVLISSPSSASLLLKEIEEHRMEKSLIEPSQIEMLRESRDPGIGKSVILLFGKDQQIDLAETISNYTAQWPTAIDAKNGKALYEQHCAKCHRERTSEEGLQPAIGPSLKALSHWTNEAWIVAILDPSRSVDNKYHRVSVRTTNDEVITGMVLTDAGETLELVLTDGRIQVLKRPEIENIKLSTLSVMPDGFEKLLTPEQLAQLVTYLRRGGE